MSNQELDQIEALRTICSEIFGRNILIDSDFADVHAWKVEREFMQGEVGVTIQFTISDHALGKLGHGAEGVIALLRPTDSAAEDPSVAFMNQRMQQAAERDTPEQAAKKVEIIEAFDQQQREGRQL